MSFQQCQAIIVLGRSPEGGRSGIIPPRKCWRVALDSGFCEVHEKQADLQNLYKSLLRPGWEQMFVRWEKDRERGVQPARRW